MITCYTAGVFLHRQDRAVLGRLYWREVNSRAAGAEGPVVNRLANSMSADSTAAIGCGGCWDRVAKSLQRASWFG